MTVFVHQPEFEENEQKVIGRLSTDAVTSGLHVNLEI